MKRWLAAGAVTGWLIVPAGAARADHDMAMSGHQHADAPAVSIGVAVQAAEFETMSYVGSYQSIAPTVAWMHGWFGANATLGLYHLDENGRGTYGMGDAMLGAHAAVIRRGEAEAGVALHVMLPTGSEVDNLGMGHVMVMPALWGAWQGGRLGASASAGYARALTSLDGAHHDHGPTPLVDPMNLQELTWSVAADVEVGHHVRLGGRAQGGVPIGDGRTRVISGGRVAWGMARVSTAFELQVGLAGDPFTVRGVLETALRF